MSSRFDMQRACEEFRNLDPYHVEFPAFCSTCGAKFSVFRAPDTCREIVLGAAQVIHHEFKPQCPADSIRIAAAIPYGGRRRRALEDHANSSTDEKWKLPFGGNPAPISGEPEMGSR